MEFIFAAIVALYVATAVFITIKVGTDRNLPSNMFTWLVALTAGIFWPVVLVMFYIDKE